MGRIERTQAEKDASMAALKRSMERERLNPSPVPPDDYVPLPTREGQVLATMIPKKTSSRTS